MSVALGVAFAGAIPDYSSLVSTVARWLDRDDLAGDVPTFIQLCEARLNRILRTPEMETVTQLTITTEPVNVPSDFLAIRALYIVGSPDSPLRGMSPAALPQEFSGASGVPVAYAVRGKAIHLAPPPSSGTTVLSLDYYAKIPALSVASGSNWLLASHPDIYLYGTLLQAEALIDNPEKVQLWKAAYDEALGELVSASNSNRWGSGPLVPNTVVQVRGARC